MTQRPKREAKTLLLIPPSFLFPMGPAYVASALEQAGYSFDIYAFLYDNRSWFRDGTHETAADCDDSDAFHWIPAANAIGELRSIIHQRQYDYILTGGLVGFFRWFYDVLPSLKGYSSGSRLILGGGMTKDVAAETLFRNLPIDYALAGEAETNLGGLLDCLETGARGFEALASIPGVICKDGSGDIRRNPVRRLDLEHTEALPAWHRFPVEQYIQLSDTLLRLGKTFFPILVGRGCPNVCAFCSPSVGRFQARPLDSVIAEMARWKQQYAFDFFFIYSEVAFDDEQFTRDFCNRMKTEVGSPWVGQLRTDVTFSVDTYRLMKDSGCMFICLGFESACDRMLAAMNKHTTVADHLRNLTRAREAGLRVFGNFMFGHDGETAEEIRTTFAFLEEHRLINHPANGLASIIIYPGTKYYRTAQKRGLVSDELQFLLTYSLKAGISSENIRETEEAGKLNISALSNDRFYETVCRETIRFRRAFNRRYRMRDVSRYFAAGPVAGFTFHGICPECGCPLAFDTDETTCPLDVAKVCSNCYYQINVDVFASSEMDAHLTVLLEQMAKYERIAVFGPWAMAALFSDRLQLPVDRIVAWGNPYERKQANRRYFYHYPMAGATLDLAERYDAVLCIWPRALTQDDPGLQFARERGTPLLNVFPDVINSTFLESRRPTTIALCGSTRQMEHLARQLGASEGAVRFQRFPDVERAGTFDLLVVAPEEAGHTRESIALTSSYRIHDVLYPEHLLESGLYAGLDLTRYRCGHHARCAMG